MSEHSALTSNHVIQDYTYADAAARTAATGFTTADVGKVALQSDNSSWWVLTDDSPVTWAEITGTGGSTTTAFTSLTDTPANYSGGAGKLVVVNQTPNAVIFSVITVDASDNLVVADKQVIRPELRDYAKTVNTVAAAGAAATLNLEVANVHDITMDQNVTFTFSNPPASGIYGEFRLILRQNGTGGFAPTWPASVDWPAATPPTVSSGPNDVDVFDFMTVDAGTTWLGFIVGQDFS